MRFTEIISESAGTRLKDIAKIATNMQDADFWLVRKGSDKTVGKPVTEFDPSRIGIKVVRTDVLDPKYLYYVMMNLHNQGHFARIANGTTNLVNIRVEDIANIPLGQQTESLNELAPSTGGEGDTNYLKTLARAWYNMEWEMLGDLVKQGKNPLEHRMKVQDAIENMLERGIHCPDGKVRKYFIGYNAEFDGVEIQSNEHYEYGDNDDAGNDIDSRTGKPWGPYDAIEFAGNELDESVAESTGDPKFDTMMNRMATEPKYPDKNVLPTSIPELIQWAEKNNKPDHWHFAQWAKRNRFTNVNDALEWFGDNVDPTNQWGPKEHPDSPWDGEWLEDAAKHDPKAAELLRIYNCYENIVFDWSDDYRQMNMPDPFKDKDLEEGETWSKHNNPRAGGMSKKSVSSYRRSHPGSKIQTAVTTKPSKIKKGSKDAKRRKSFCARMRGMKKHNTSAKTAHDPNSNINKSLRRWNCESIEQMEELLMLAEQMVAKARKEIL